LGLASWNASLQNSVRETTAAGTEYYGLSDRDMLACQTALTAAQQKQDRISTLNKALGQ
jgi:hypothetical protein